MKPTRGDSIAPFYAMEAMKAANEREAAGHTVLHMELGEPGGGAPAPVIEAARELLRTRGAELGYTEALGIPELRQRIAQRYGETYGVELEPDRVIVTTGSSAAFLLGFLAAFGDGARIGLTEPGYPAYRNIVKALGMEAVGIATEADTRYQPTPELLDGAGALDGLVIASPANPTGTMLDRDALTALVGWARERGVRLISDEVYHGITYADAAVSVAGLTTEAVVVNSFSKYFAMTGWRLGWMVAPPELVRPVERLAQNLFLSPPALAQHAALAAFRCTGELDARVAGYARNREVLLEALPRAGFDRLAPADGAFYIFADVRGLTDDSAVFCARMLEETGVAATPGIDFDPRRGERFIRFSIAGPAAAMEEAARRLVAWQGGRGKAPV